MKTLLFCAVLSIAGLNFDPAFAQNIGIGIKEPLNKLQVAGNFLVNAPYVSTASLPTPAQTKTMINGMFVSFLISDSTGRLYDPGGPSGDYIANLIAYATIYSEPEVIGMEITFEDIDLGAGDSLIIRTGVTPYDTLLAIGNGYNTLGKIIINTREPHVTFKSNADGINGRGFNLVFRRLYNTSLLLPGLSGFAGEGLFFETQTGAFRTGLIRNGKRGNYSTAFGYEPSAGGLYSTAAGFRSNAGGQFSLATGSQTAASGFASTALGRSTTASGSHATAITYLTQASGECSFAAGRETLASGINSTSLGSYTQASGNYSTALGYLNIASGHYSTAIGGGNISTNGAMGAFILGDHTGTAVMNSGTANSFTARFAGGYTLYSNSGLTSGMTLTAGGNSWSAVSDVNRKENISPVNGELFLKNIAGMPLSSWNYKGQDRRTLRHYGPMAQDFFKAFGKDDYGTIGSDTLINQQDFLGVNLIAIQALEKRTVSLQQQLDKVTALLKLYEEKITFPDNKDILPIPHELSWKTGSHSERVFSNIER